MTRNALVAQTQNEVLRAKLKEMGVEIKNDVDPKAPPA
jgi:hypothetical protein